jgi:mercuric ion binding protein
MKAIQLTLFSFFLLVTTTFAQQSVTKKIVIKTPNAACEECKEHIEAFMTDEEGVMSVEVNIKKRTTTIVYVTDKTNDENLKAALSNMGFDADDVPAEPTVIKLLPRCCQKAIPAPVKDSTIKKSN